MLSTSLPFDGPLRVAIVGAGFSGLAAAIRAIDLATRAGRTLDLTLFEASRQVGGLVATQRIGGYLVERGADSFITNKPGGVWMCRRLGLDRRLMSTDPRFRQSFILRQGRPEPTPAGFQLIAPTRLGPFLKSPLVSWRGKKRVLAEPRIPQRQNDEDESVAAFARRRFGDEAFERVIQPLVGGIYTGDLERLSLSATFPRFAEMERRHGSVLRALRRQRTGDTSGARYGLFVSLPGGMGELLEAMSGEVKKTQAIRMGEKVHRLASSKAHGWELETNGGKSTFHAVILAVPAFHSAELVQPVQPQLASELDGIEYSSSAIVVSGHRLEDVRHPLNGAGLVIPHVENRRILAVSFASRKFPGRAPDGRVVLRTFLGGALQAGQLEQDDESLKQVVKQELREILGVHGEPDFVEVVRYSRGIPQFVIGHQARVARIEHLMRQQRGLCLAGNAYHGVGIPDAISSGLVAADKVWRDIAGELPADVDSIASLESSGNDPADSGHHSAAGLTT